MFKVILRLLIVLNVFVICLSVSSCTQREENVMNDQQIANANLEQVIEAIQSENADAVFALFAAEQRENAELRSRIEQLLSYYDGEMLSYDDWGGPVADELMQDGHKQKTFDCNYNVETTCGTYRVFMRWIVEDTADSNRVGLRSFYIVKAESDADFEYAYWGDGKYTPGLHIGIKEQETP